MAQDDTPPPGDVVVVREKRPLWRTIAIAVLGLIAAILVLACAVLVAVLSLLSGLGAMRSLLRADPATLLR